MIRSILSGVPFVLCSLRAPDAGGGLGGSAGNGNASVVPTDALAPVSASPPEPKGDSLEVKLESARNIIRELFGKIAELTSQLSTATSDRDRLDGQFNTVTADLAKEKEDHAKSKDALVLATGKVSTLTSERDASNRNVERLEKLCAVRGVDSKETVTVPAEESTVKTDSNSPAGKWQQYQDLRKKEKAGTIEAGRSRKFWNENKEALQKFGASQRDQA